MEQVTKRPTKKELIDAAFKHVHEDREKFVRIVAMEHTIANMGQSLEDFVGPGMTPYGLVQSCYNRFAEEAGAEGISIDGECRSWLKSSRRDVERVEKAGLPLTLENVRMAFDGKGPFEKKAKATASSGRRATASKSPKRAAKKGGKK